MKLPQSYVSQSLIYLLCSPELTPQRTGLVDPPGLVTENESVKHCDAVDTSTPPAFVAPFRILVEVSVKVLGPVMTKVLKSSLI